MFVKRSPAGRFGSILAVVILTGGLLLVAASAANATLMLQLQRIDDFNAVLTGSGSTNSPGTDLLFLDGAFQLVLSATASISGDFALGGVVPIGADSFFTNFRLFFSGTFPELAVPSGSLLVTVPTNIWAPVGSSGTVIGEGPVQGTWEMVRAVPEPTTLALFGIGLAGLGFFMRRRRVV